MKAKRLSFVSAACVAAFCSTSFAYTISGSVSDDQGQAIKGVTVDLLKEGKTTTTDDQGKFTIHEDEESIGINPSFQNSVGYIGINKGILSYSQSSASPVQVKIYNSLGNQVFSKTLQGSGTYDLTKGIKARGTYFAQVSVGSAKQNFKFTTDGSFSSAIGSQDASALMKAAQAGEAIRFAAPDYDTLTINLNTLDTTLNVKLTKVLKEQTYAFGFAMKNAPRASKGCGKDGTLKGTINYQCGGKDDCSAQQFSINAGGLNRTYYMTFPKNYDKNKPYKLLIANHCMGSESNHVATWVDHDQDHISPYYSQKALDTEENYIFVAPQGESNGTWQKGEKDHQFIDALITHIEDNYCIDTSRVFATGFSFGAMFTNSLAQTFQHRIRAVAVYAVADFNIYIPTNAGKPIAWMDVHGVDDGLCTYSRVDDAINRILANNGPDGTDARGEKATKWSGGPHVCYDYKNVDPRFPVKLCTWKGGHQWTANDDGNYRNTWVPKTVHEFFEQF